MEKYIEDARQDEKHVSDLLEAIIQPPGLAKEELRQIVFKIMQFRPESQKIRVWPKSEKFQNGFVDGPSPFFEAANPFSRYLAPLGAKYMQKRSKKNIKNNGFSPFGAGYSIAVQQL